jgi:hypothetical protein
MSTIDRLTDMSRRTWEIFTAVGRSRRFNVLLDIGGRGLGLGRKVRGRGIDLVLNVRGSSRSG